MTVPLPFPNGALLMFLDIAFGADIDGDQNLWEWTPIATGDFAGPLLSQEITTTRGRPDEASDVAPTQAGLRLDNPDGRFTPDNAASIYYPNVDLGTPARWGVISPLPRLLLHSSHLDTAYVASTSALDITTDLDVRIDVETKSTSPYADTTILAGRAINTAFSWRLDFLDDHRVRLLWSATGTTPAMVAVSTVAVLPMLARQSLRVTLDVDNGAGGYDVRFYVGSSVDGPWMQIGDTVTDTPVTSIFNAIADVVIGLPADGEATQSLEADVYRFQLLDGIDGPAVADADFTAQTPGATSFVDSVGRTWLMSGDAQISDRWYRIVGTVDEWAPQWPWGDLSDQQPSGLGVGQARVDITINGILRRLGQGALPLFSALRRSIEDDPLMRAYWPMEDEKDSSQFASALSNGSPMPVGGEIDFSSDDSLVGSKPLPKISGTTFFSGPVSGTFLGEWQFDWYMYMPTGFTGSWTILRGTTTGTVRSWEVRFDDPHINIEVRGFDQFGTLITSSSVTMAGFLDRWNHMRLYAVQNGANVDYTIKYNAVTYPPTTDPSTTNSFAGSVGEPTGMAFTAGSGMDGLITGHWAVFAGSDLDTTGPAAMGWMGETAMERIARLCSEQGISLRVIGASAETALMGPQRVASLLDLLNDAADADGGILYEQQYRVGLTYRARSALYNQPSNIHLSGVQNQVANPFKPILDDQRIRNAVTVTREDGSSSTATNTASISKHGLYDESVTLNLLLDSQTSDAAGWRVHQGTVGGMRYPQMTIDLGVAPEIITSWLSADVGSKISITGLPPQHPSSAVRLMIEGYSEPVSPTRWEPTASCSPAQVWDVTELDGDWVPDEYLLRLETDGSVLALPATQTQTSLFVQVTRGPYWVTDPAEFPLDINAHGEQMTVTAIGPATGGEEFVGAGAYDDVVSTSSFVAPSVTAFAAGDLLLAAWSSSDSTGTYVLPGGMTIGALTSGVLCSFEDAREILGGSGPTGTRTVTFSGSDTWSAISLIAHGDAGTPTIDDYQSAVASAAPISMTVQPSEIGQWIVVMNGHDWDPGATMGPPTGTDWVLLAQSSDIGVLGSSRIRVWGKKVLSVAQPVSFSVSSGVGDNHVRSYLLSGVTGITQEFTVIRSVNGIVKSHPAITTSINLWYQPVLAR